MQAARKAAKRPEAASLRTPNTVRSFRPDIEGLRAVAVGLVLLNHAGLPWFRGGYVGVDVFFVLSGFLITGILLREIEQTGSVSLARFYARRARRLLPAGALVLLATLIASHVVIGGARADRIAVDARWTALFASNYRFIQQGTDYMNATLPPSPVQHYWSLAVEEQFYVVWPLVLILAGLAGRRAHARAVSAVALMAIVLASFAWSMHFTALNGTAAYFSPLTRAWELGLGGLLAIATPGISRLPARASGAAGWVGLGAVLYAAMTFTETTAFPGHAAALPVLGTCLVVVAGSISANRGVERLLAIGPAQMVGRLSYSLYLWHWPVLVIGAAWAGRDLRIRENLALCSLALGLSALTFRLVEQPVRDAEWLRARKPAWSLALGASLTALVLFGASVSQRAHTAEPVAEIAMAGTVYLPDEAQILRAVGEGVDISHWPAQPKRIANPAYSDECDVTRADTTSSMCVHGDPHGARVMVVFGDSHAAMWIPALDLVGKQEGWQVVQLTKPGCQAPDFPRYSPTMKREYTECAEYRTWALDRIDQLAPDVVVIASSSRDAEAFINGAPTNENFDQIWADGLTSVVRRIDAAAGRVILLGEMPYPAQPGIDCLTAHEDDVGACNTPRDQAVLSGMIAIEQRVAVVTDATFVDVVPWFCTNTTCPAVIGGLTTHRDEFHAAENYVVWLSNVLGKSVGMIPEGRTITMVTLPATN